MTCKVRCIYVDGKPQPRVFVLLSPHELAKVVIVMNCMVYAFAFKEEAKEFLRQVLRLENFEIGPCPN
jgi:hypothetical protein